MRLQCPKCTTEFDLRPPSGGRRRSRVQFRCTECGTPLGLEELRLEDDEDAPSELPSVAGMVPDLLEPDQPPEAPTGSLPFEPPSDPVVERFQAEMASLGQEVEGGGDGALLKQDGKVYHVRNTATIQRWVVERRVLREDLISTGGMRWEPVGGHPDLEIFFQMVERLDALEQTGAPPQHDTSPPVADQAAEPWAENSDPGLPMPEEEEEEVSDLPSEPEITGPVYISEEDDDLDSEISAIPFAIKGSTKKEPPASVSVEPFEHSDGLPEMRAEPVPLGEADPETAESQVAETVAMGTPPPLPVSTGPIDEPTQARDFDEDAFFAREPDPDPTVVGPVASQEPPPVPTAVEKRAVAVPIVDDREALAWEEDRRERRQRMGIIGAVVAGALLALGGWWWSQREPTPELGGEQPVLAEGTQPEEPVEAGQEPEEVEPPPSEVAEPTPSDPPAQEAPKDPPPSEARPTQTKAPPKPPKDPPREREPVRKAPNTDAGWTAMGSGDFNGARLIFVEAVAANPRNADAHYGLGYAAQKQGDQATAIRHYCKALDLGPGNREIQQTVPSLLSSMEAACP